MINLPTDLLRTFTTVMDLGGITRAAEVLGRSQPAISLQLKRLEELIDIPLFVRAGKRVKLTEDGEALGVYARQILALNDEAVSRLRSPRVGGVVRVGLPSDFAVSILPTILGGFTRAHDGITLEVTCGISRDLVRGMEKQDYDVVIALCGESPFVSLAKTWTDRLVWVSNGDASLLAEEPLPLIVYPQGCLYRQRTVEALNRAGRNWRVAYSSPSQSGIEAAVKAGLGVTVLSEKTVPSSLVPIAVENGFPGLADVEVGLFYRQPDLSEAGLRLVNYITGSMDSLHSDTTDSRLDHSRV
ncbi:LysR substrate-binding domain-containing protein [Kiloniella laminariae]|uniref:LysR substrate-binding domain-containing protein n=1 Tax=Kiloniella laminariae TaxID=454162 RepID=A0ABT4LIX5_9PROT|nr:LysR substrate-binding domain-containing protein [Kiloniella laminariae]MCZ4281059.1 LysR substrate-binding domain-containing protein [Kiloniella laminariae]